MIKYFENPARICFLIQLDWRYKKASHRDFKTGFYYQKPSGDEQIYDSSSYIREYDFIGLVLDYNPKTKTAIVEQRNRMFAGDEIEVVTPKKCFTQKITSLKNDKNEEIEVAHMHRWC